LVSIEQSCLSTRFTTHPAVFHARVSHCSSTPIAMLEGVMISP